jgi:hypothetical protein
MMHKHIYVVFVVHNEEQSTYDQSLKSETSHSPVLLSFIALYYDTHNSY